MVGLSKLLTEAGITPLPPSQQKSNLNQLPPSPLLIPNSRKILPGCKCALTWELNILGSLVSARGK